MDDLYAILMSPLSVLDSLRLADAGRPRLNLLAPARCVIERVPAEEPDPVTPLHELRHSPLPHDSATPGHQHFHLIRFPFVRDEAGQVECHRPPRA